MSETSYCSWSICRDGHCEGCRNGELWCHDPRCFPFCADERCYPRGGNDYDTSLVIFFIIFCLLFLIMVILLMHGPEFIVIDDGDTTYNMRGIDFYLD